MIDYSDHAKVSVSRQREYLALSAPIFYTNQMYLLEPHSCLRLCKGIYKMVINGDLLPLRINDAMKEAHLELHEISGKKGEKLLVTTFYPKFKRLGFVGINREWAVEGLLANYAKHILSSQNTYLETVRLSLAYSAMTYLNMLKDVGVSGIASEMRVFHWAFSFSIWPKLQSATSEFSTKLFENLEQSMKDL